MEKIVDLLKFKIRKLKEKNGYLTTSMFTELERKLLEKENKNGG